MPELDANGNIVQIQDEVDLDDLEQQIDNAISTAQTGLAALEDAQWDPRTAAQKAEALRQIADHTLAVEIRMLKAWRYVMRKLSV